MKTKFENLDNIVFDNRNQNYGAYFLRKNYTKYLSRALFLAVLLFSGSVSIPLIAVKMHLNQKIENTVVAEMDPNLLNKPPEKQELPEIPDVPEQKAVKVPTFTPPVVVMDTEDVTNNFGELIDSTQNGVINEKVKMNDYNLIAAEPEENKVLETETVEKPFIFVELMPRFKGGEKAMYSWLNEHIVYPQIAKESGIQGNVIVTFVVEKDGSITDVQILRDIGGGCGEEAVRVVKAMPKWNEGRQNNIPVRVQFNLPIKFALE